MLDTFQRKVGPFPAWVWLIVATIIVVFLMSRRRSSSSSDNIFPIPRAYGPNDTWNDGGATMFPQRPYYGESFSAPVASTGSVPTVSSGERPNSAGNNVVQRLRSAFGIVPQSIRTDPVAASPQSTIEAAADFGAAFGEPVGTIGTYLTRIGEKPTFAANRGSAIVNIPGTTKTQGATLMDAVAESQRQIARSPALRAEIARANVTDEQRKYALVGDGGILIFGSGEHFPSTN